LALAVLFFVEFQKWNEKASKKKKRNPVISPPPFSSVSFSCPLPSVGATTGCWQYFNIGSIIVRIDRLEGTTLGDDAN
jgi:hypothetical protein